LAGTIVDGAGFVNSGGQGVLRFKTAGKTARYQRDIVRPGAFSALALKAFNQKRQICALPEICC
jgi:hypothetical protein